MINRDAYFAYVRDVLFEGALSQSQVDGQMSCSHCGKAIRREPQ
jgi:hypothetical protein